MASNFNKIDNLHTLVPKQFNSKTNPNWKALIEAIGASDDQTAQLIEEVKKQFFIKTAYRPYLDRLGGNVNVNRPKFIGMTDKTYKKYIPVMSYQPKQVKAIIDAILEVFFFKESTNAYIQSLQSEGFTLVDGWELDYLVDSIHEEHIEFNAVDFVDISNATASEIASIINRQAKFSFAVDYFDHIQKLHYVQLFSNTVGSKGSMQITGGRANIGLQFQGFLLNSGNGSNTQWTITKIGDKVTYSYNGGANPGLNEVQEGDYVISGLAGNVGSFKIINVNLGDEAFTIVNLLGTPGSFTQSSAAQMKFFRPEKHVVFTVPNRAVSWETVNGEITIEMPTAPPVIKQSLKGSAHINGFTSVMTNRNSSSSMTLADTTNLLNSGYFLLQEETELLSHVVTPSEDTVVAYRQHSRITSNEPMYHFTSRTVATTTGDITAGSTRISNLADMTGIALGQTVFAPGLRMIAKVRDIGADYVEVTVPADESTLLATIAFGGDTLTGITPPLPELAALHEFELTDVTRTSNIVVCTTDGPHDYLVGETVGIRGCSGIPVITTTGDTTEFSNTVTNIPNTATAISPGQRVIGVGIPSDTFVLDVVVGATITITLNNQATITDTGVTLDFTTEINGPHIITEVTSDTFSFVQQGANGTADVPGESAVERSGLANDGSKFILYTTQSSYDTGIKGPYLWDLAAPFVLSANNSTIDDEITAGKIVRILNIGENTIPEQGGLLIFDYGLPTQEGPVRYLYKPTENTLAIDPSYIFLYSHTAGSSINAIRQKGPHVFKGDGAEYAPYITDPSQAREVFKSIILSVKSAGIFVDFLIRFPETLYGTLDIYQSGKLPE